MRTRYAAVSAIILAAAAIAGCGSSSKSSTTTGSASSGGGASSSGAGYSPPAAPASSTKSAASAGGQVVKVSADASNALRFTSATLHAKAGKVTVQLSNPASLPHSIAIEGHGVDKSAPSPIGQGQTTSVTVSLKPGTYTFYCPVPGHRQAGMQGKLIVK